MKSKILKAVALVATAFLVFSLAGCKDPGKAGPGKKVTVWVDGEHSLGIQNSRKTMAAIDPPSSCSWTLMYDIPNRPGKVVVVSKGGAKSAKSGVKMKGPKQIKYKDPKTGKMVTTKNHPTSFYSENCGTWKQK